jgi:hypothetical protein
MKRYGSEGIRQIAKLKPGKRPDSVIQLVLFMYVTPLVGQFLIDALSRKPVYPPGSSFASYSP